jgi:hypothetical protein
MRWRTDPSTVFHLVSPVTNGTIILSARAMMNAPCHLTSGWCPVPRQAGAGGVVLQVVKAAQSRGRAERPPLYNSFPAPSRAAGMLRKGVVRHCHIKAVSQLLWTDKDREVWFSLRENHEKAYRFGLHQLRKLPLRLLHPSHQAGKARQGRRRKTALRCEYLTPP